MTHSIRWPAVVLLPLVVLGSLACNPTRKAFHSGKYEKTIESAVNKLRRNRTDEQQIAYLEAAYTRLYNRELQQIAFWKKEGRPENAVAIYDRLSELRYYQNLISPLLPLYMPSKKRQAKFTWVADADYIAAQRAAAEYLYARAKALLATGYRDDARQAYSLLQELNDIFPNYQDAAQLERQALAQGTNKVLLRMVNNSGAPLFGELEKHLTSLPVGNLSRSWVMFTNVPDAREHYDYTIVLNIRQLTVSPDLQLPPRIYTETKQIPDGWEFVTDAQGNPVKDSTGAYIKKPKYRTISCMVTEYVQQKFATVGGHLEFYQGSNKVLLHSYPVHVHKVFEHYWATANGDLNALSPESYNKIQTGPAIYPSEIGMVVQAADELKVITLNMIRDHLPLLRN